MGSYTFFTICLLHSTLALSCGALMMFYANEISAFGHGSAAASQLRGSTSHDQLLIQTSHSFSGLLLFSIGLLLLMAAFVTDKGFHSFFAKGCIMLHLMMAIWRLHFERRLEDLAWDLTRQVLGDFTLALSWIFFLLYS
uniref:DUF7865 domain-containing protein n=1 Tax=Kalanchoe fedtschenkoi TaxID=63787 RepID=A0A7N0V4N0_KALFE